MKFSQLLEQSDVEMRNPAYVRGRDYSEPWVLKAQDRNDEPSSEIPGTVHHFSASRRIRGARHKNKMKKSQYIFKSFINALGVLAYISGVALIMFNMEHAFDNEPSFLVPVLMLLLFVTSAAITGSLVLGKPVMLYLDNQKKEALVFLVYTLAWLVIFMVLTLLTLWMF